MCGFHSRRDRLGGLCRLRIALIELFLHFLAAGGWTLRVCLTWREALEIRLIRPSLFPLICWLLALAIFLNGLSFRTLEESANQPKAS